MAHTTEVNQQSEQLGTSFPKEKVKILLLEGVHPVSVKQFEQAGYTNVELLPKALPEAELLEKIKDARIVGIRSKTQMNEKVIAHAKKLMAIGCFCIGTNQVNLEKAKEKGIAVFNSPYSNTRSVAELVIAEIVILMRRVAEKSHAAHKGEWLKSAENSHEVRGKTIGIIGYGHIGSQVSVLAEAMGMRVLYYDIVPKLPLGNAIAVGSMDELLAQSDVVTLHVPADPSTENMITQAQLSKMKKGAILLNLSRGTVVDIDALATALEGGHLNGAGIDVYPKEPRVKGATFETPLQGLKNVILTPHIGGSTQEAQYNIGLDAAYKLINYLDKGITVGCHTVPELNLPIHRNTHRILHIHENVPGVLANITSILAELNINIVGQYLSTNDKIGYVVVDVDSSASQKALNGLKQVAHTIRARVLY